MRAYLVQWCTAQIRMKATLTSLGSQHIVTATHAELDLTDQAAVRAFFARQRIDVVVPAAAKVGGIHANNTEKT